MLVFVAFYWSNLNKNLVCVCITNGTTPEADIDWTFRSPMGIKRRIDYIIASKCFIIKETGPSEILNLGSDDRVVRSVLISQKRNHIWYVKKVQMKNWRPCLDPEI